MRGKPTVLAVGIALLAAACGGSSAKHAPAKGATSTTRPRPRPPVIAPLTGLRDPTRATQTRPALTVKVENTPQARPLSGVDKADVVYEEVVECGITRLAAIFQSQVPDVVGPVRSVRKTDQAIVRPIQGIFAFSGGAQYALDSINTAPVVQLDETRAGDAMFRDHSRKAPENLYGRGPQLYAKAPDAHGPPPPLFSYRAANAKAGGIPATHAVVGFRGGRSYATTWDWDAATRSYRRGIFGRPDVPTSGAQLTATNVVIQFVSYTGGAGTCASIGAQANLTREGVVWVLSGGRLIKGRWSRPDPELPGDLLDAKGRVIRLAPGNTWVELPGTDYTVTAGSPPVG